MKSQRTPGLRRHRGSGLAVALTVPAVALGGLLVSASPSLASVSAGATVLTDTTDPTDTAAPVVTQVEVSRRSVDTHRRARTVSVTMQVTDPGTPGDDASGVVPFVVRLGIRPWLPAQTATMLSGTTYDGVWRARFTIPRWAGHRFLTPDVRAVDAAGNTTRISAPDQRVQVRSGTDSTLPRVAFLRGVPKVFHAQQGAHTYGYRLRLTDRPTGVASARVDLLMPKKKDPEGLSRILVSDAPTRLSGTARDGRWRGAVTLEGGWIRDVTLDWRITVVDQRGNVRVYWRKALESHGSRAHTLVKVSPSLGGSRMHRDHANRGRGARG